MAKKRGARKPRAKAKKKTPPKTPKLVTKPNEPAPAKPKKILLSAEQVDHLRPIVQGLNNARQAQNIAQQRLNDALELLRINAGLPKADGWKVNLDDHVVEPVNAPPQR